MANQDADQQDETAGPDRSAQDRPQPGHGDTDRPLPGDGGRDGGADGGADDITDGAAEGDTPSMSYGNDDDGQDYVDRSVIDFDPEDGLYNGTAVDGTSDIPGSGGAESEGA